MTASDTASDAERHASAPLPWSRFRWSEDTGLIVVFILMVLAIGIPHPEFFSFGSIKTILRQSALVGIIAFGMVYLVAMVEIDLSVGGIFAVASSLSALLIKFYHVDPWIAVALALLAGVCLGGLNGVLTSLLKVPLIIVSLGTLSAYFGLHLILSDGKAIYGLPKSHPFFQIFGSDLLGLAGVGLDGDCLRHRALFRFCPCALRRNRPRHRLEPGGGRIHRHAYRAYSHLCDCAGRFLVGAVRHHDARLLQGCRHSSGRSLGLQVIAAVVIGGTSLAGGSGTIIGAALGVLIITTIDSGLVFYNVNLNYSEFVTGIVIIGAIALDRIAKRRRTP